MYDAEAIIRLLFTPKLTKEKCRQSYNLAKNVLRRITKITIFSSHPGKNENCRQNNDRSPLSLSNAVYSNMRIIQVDLDQKGIKKGGGGGCLSFLFTGDGSMAQI